VKALEEKALGDGSEAATISNSLKVCVNRLSSSSGKNSCPLNTGIPIESLGIELQYRALIHDSRRICRTQRAGSTSAYAVPLCD
jgi:hypothetical protein